MMLPSSPRRFAAALASGSLVAQRLQQERWARRKDVREEHKDVREDRKDVREDRQLQADLYKQRDQVNEHIVALAVGTSDPEAAHSDALAQATQHRDFLSSLLAEIKLRTTTVRGEIEGVTVSNEERAERRRLLEASHTTADTLDAEGWFLRGNAAFEARDFEESLAAYDRSLELRPDDPVTLTNRGAVLGRLGQHEEALEADDRALELRPDDPDTLTNHGLALFDLGWYDEALEAYDRSLELRSDDPNTLTSHGAALHNLDQYEEALAAYDRSLELRADHVDTLTDRGLALADLGRYEEALAAYDRSHRAPSRPRRHAHQPRARVGQPRPAHRGAPGLRPLPRAPPRRSRYAHQPQAHAGEDG